MPYEMHEHEDDNVAERKRREKLGTPPPGAPPQAPSTPAGRSPPGRPVEGATKGPPDGSPALDIPQGGGARPAHGASSPASGARGGGRPHEQRPLGFEHLWGLGPEVAELEESVRANRRAWAAKRRAEIAAKAATAGGAGGGNPGPSPAGRGRAHPRSAKGVRAPGGGSQKLPPI